MPKVLSSTGLRAAFLLLPLLASPARAQDIDDFQFELTTLGGRRVTQDDFRDNVLLVDYWGTWCGPCVSVVPTLQAMYAKYKHYGLEIVGLSYERGRPNPAPHVREFAAKRGLTYPIALGTPAEQAQVPGFRAYPTMLYFGRGLQHRKTDVGVSGDFARELEQWIRSELGLDQPADPDAGEQPAGGAGSQPQARGEKRGPVDDGRVELTEGQVFKPGDGDRGFRFTLPGADGKPLAPTDLAGDEVTMQNLVGKPFVLALTSTWDQSAKATAELLQRLHEAHGERATVLGAYLEMPRERDKKVAAMQRFRSEGDFDFRAFPAGLAFQRKVHMFTGMPLLLVFDADGVLVRRESGVGTAVEAALRDTLAKLLD